MIIKLLSIIIACGGVVLLATVVYVAILLALAKVTASFLKFLVTLVPYLAMCVVLVYPMVPLFRWQRSYLPSNFGFAVALLSFFVAVSPCVIYIYKYKINELRNAGYFKPRK